jgi:hypothetical protein
MSMAGHIFASYFAVGLILMAIAVATRGKERRAKYLDISHASPVDAGLMIFIALLWPVWLLMALLSDDDRKR